MACNSKENTLNLLRNNGIIKDNNIVDSSRLNTFNTLNEKYTEFAKTEYGVSNGKLLFTLNENNEIQFNEELFEAINTEIEKRDQANEDQFEPIDFEDTLYEATEKFLPKYEKYIIYKENLLRRLNDRLARIQVEKKKFASDTSKLKELVKLENDINTRVNGSEELGIKGLEEEIIELKKAPPIEKFRYYAEKDFERLDKLSKSDNIEDLHEAKVIIGFYEAVGNFDVNIKNPLFELDDIFDGQGNNVLPQDVIQTLSELKERAKNYENGIEQKTKKAVLDVINNNNKVKGVFNEELDYDTIFYGDKGLKDASWIDMFMMDITNGILSHNGIVPQVMMNLIQNSFESNLVYAKSVENRTNDLQAEVEKELTKLGYSISVPGIKGVSYDLFRATDENGQFKDSITQRYTSKFIEEKNKMFYEFDSKLKAAKELEKPAQKQQAFKDAYTFRDNWYRKNTIFLDIRKMPEVVNDPSLASFKEHFINDAGYKQQLTDILGEQGYKEEVSKQIKLLRNYQTALDVFTDNLIAQAGAADINGLSEKEKSQLEMWIKRNNPFIMMDSFTSGKSIQKGKLNLNSTMAYNYSVPRKNKVAISIKDGKYQINTKEENTNFYDKRFETIESNPTLKEFHNLLMEVTQKMYDTMPLEVREKMSAFSIPALKKNILEILFDKNTPLYQRLSKAAREIYDRIRALFGINPQDNLSYANVDPITGQPEYKVNSQFLKSNKQEINRRYKIEILRLKKALGLKITDKIGKYDTFDLTKASPQAIGVLAENLGVEPSLAALKKALANEDLKVAEVGKILKNGITHQIVQDNSFDLPKILKLYSYLTMEYAARQEVLPTVEMLKKHYEQIKSPSTTNLGQSITNNNTGETRLEGERVKAMKQMNSWFERVALGNYGSKNEFGDTRIKRAAKLGQTGNEKIDRFTSKLQTTVTGKILDTDEKLMNNKIQGLKEELQEVISNSKDESEINNASSMLKGLLNTEAKLGKQFSAAAAFDALFNFIRFKGLGWNLSSYVTNFMEGQIANMTVAATGDYFTPENIYRANDIVKGSFAKNLSFGKFATPGAKKTRVLMDRYRILQDASNELQKASAKSAFSSFRNLSPYEGTRRTEYLNQAPLMIAVLMDQQIVGANGENSNLWDAMNPNGTLKEEFRTEDNIKNWEQSDGAVYNDFSSHMRKLIVNAHGDYDELRGMMASEYVTGKALLMFKRWMSRQFYQRFAMIPQADLEVGMSDYKGRYLSHTQSSGFMHGAIIGFGGLGLLGAGPLGLLIGGGAGLLGAKFYGANTGLGFLKESAFVGKELLLNLMRIPVNNITGKETIKSNDYELLKEQGLSERDIKNMKANLVDMSLTLSWVAMMLFAKGLLWDDEDEEDSTRRQAHNLLVNRFMQLSSQATMYANPVETWENTVGSLPLLRFLKDVGKTATEAEDFLEGKDTIPSGPNAGESALYRQISRTFFPGIIKGNLGFEVHMSKQFEKSPFDTWFHGDEKKSKKAVQSIRADYRKQLEDGGMKDEKEIEKKVNAKYRKKKKDEKYTDLLKDYAE